MANNEIESLIDLFDYRAEQSGNQHAYSFLKRGKDLEATLTYADIQLRSRAVAAALQGRIARGDRALLMYSPGLEFIIGFIGCLYAGIIAVPAYPPGTARPERNLPRLQSIAASADISIILTTELILETLETILRGEGELNNKPIIASDTVDEQQAEDCRVQVPTADTLALLQYTSGSTASPKGVMVTHGNLMHNLRLLNICEGNDQLSIGLSWLPAYHDMGLIEGILLPAFGKYPGYLMAPTAFIQRPASWLKAISHFRVSNSGGPNFAYRYCVQKVTQQERQNIDLTSWRVAYNGSEPVQLDTIRKFNKRFRECGFKPESFRPVYGLAESTLLVSVSPIGSLPISKRLDRKKLSEHKVKEIPKEESASTTIVSCGIGDPDAKILIVDVVTNTECASNKEGEIWLSGSSVAQGYWNNPEDTEYTFSAYLTGTTDGPYLRTGDLGFISDGNLYITGRIKDLIIIRGRKLYPQDIENIVERCHPQICHHGVAAFSIEGISSERLVVMAELDARLPKCKKQLAESQTTKHDLYEEIMANIVESISDLYETSVSEVLLVPRGHVCKTSSGKIQRFACKQYYLAGGMLLARWQNCLSLNSVKVSQGYQGT